MVHVVIVWIQLGGVDEDDFIHLEYVVVLVKCIIFVILGTHISNQITLGTKYDNDLAFNFISVSLGQGYKYIFDTNTILVRSNSFNSLNLDNNIIIPIDHHS